MKKEKTTKREKVKINFFKKNRQFRRVKNAFNKMIKELQF